jgi:Cu2+-exporting ATPase
MSCCASTGAALAMMEPHHRGDEVRLASRLVAEGVSQTDIAVPGIHCGGCIQKIEKAIGAAEFGRYADLVRT